MSSNPLVLSPITQRCLAMTGSFETSTAPPDCFSSLTGDFDKMGMSFGVLQWNLGQGTLQPLLQQMIADHEDVIAGVFHQNLDVLNDTLRLPRPDQVKWARSIQDLTNYQLFEPWKGMFLALGRTPEFQAIQVAHAENIRVAAVAMCQRFGVTSERALALMFDIRVQNGSISPGVEALIRREYNAIPAGDPMEVEVARLRVIANRRAEAAKQAFVEDVRARKLCIANGEGTVHGVKYHLADQFGIGLDAIPA